MVINIAKVRIQFILLRTCAHLFLSSSVMRFKDRKNNRATSDTPLNQGNLELAYAGPGILGSTLWQVNRKAINVVLRVWYSGERMCRIPPAVYDGPAPQKPENYEADPKARLVYLTRQKAWSEGKASNHSNRCSVHYKIEIARW